MTKVYVVLGEWSDYDSHSKWMVRGFTDQGEAQSFLSDCQDIADDLRKQWYTTYAEYQQESKKVKQWKNKYPHPGGFTKEWEEFSRKYNDIFNSYKSELDLNCCVSCGDGTTYMIEELEVV